MRNALLRSDIDTLQKLSTYTERETLKLFQLLMNFANRALVRDTLLSIYFPAYRAAYYEHKELDDGFYHDIQALVLNDPEVKYKQLSIQTEEDVFVRSGLFKRYIPQLYNDTCAMTGMRMHSTFKYNFIDACHIVPFAASHDDKVTNGIALCPNLHRAFDRGVVGVDDDYRIIVSAHVHDDVLHPYSLIKLKGRPIILPQ